MATSGPAAAGQPYRGRKTLAFLWRLSGVSRPRLRWVAELLRRVVLTAFGIRQWCAWRTRRGSDGMFDLPLVVAVMDGELVFPGEALDGEADAVP